MKTCFSAGKLMKQFGPPPLQLTPLFLSNFFMIPLFVQILKTRTPPPKKNFFFGGGGGETMNKFNQNCANLLIYKIIPTKCKFVIYFHTVPVAPVASFWCLHC